MDKKIAAIRELQQNLYSFFHDGESTIKCEYYDDNQSKLEIETGSTESERVDMKNKFSISIPDEVTDFEPIAMSFDSQKKNRNTVDELNMNSSTIIEQQVDNHNEKQEMPVGKYMNSALEQVDRNGPRQKICALGKHIDVTDGQQHGTFGPKKELCSELCIVVEGVEQSTNITQEVDVNGPIHASLPVVQDIDKCIDSDPMQELCVVVDGIDTSADNDRHQRLADGPIKELFSKLCNDVEGTNIVQEQLNVNGSTQELCAKDTTQQEQLPLQQSTHFDNLTIIDFDQHAEVYEIVQDSNDPTLFCIQPRSCNNLQSECTIALDPCVERVSGREAVSIHDSSISFDDVKKSNKEKDDDLIKDIDLIKNVNLTKDDDLIKNLTANNLKTKDCRIILKDIFVKKNQSNPLANVKFCFETNLPHRKRGKQKMTKNSYESTTASVKKLNKKAKTTANPIKINTMSKRSQSNNKKDKGKNKNMKGTSTLQSLNPPGSAELSKEEKTSLIINWIHGSSPETTPGDDLDVNELLQNAILSSSDIEDDAFQLAKYMEKGGDITNILNSEQNVNNTLMVSHSQYPSKPKTISTAPCNLTLDFQSNSDQALDLSFKQTSPCSTDTGLGNGSCLMDQTSTVQGACNMMIQSKCIENNSHMDGGKRQKNFAQLYKCDQNKNNSRDCFKTNESLKYHRTELLSQKSSTNTSASSIQDDNNKTAEKEVPTKRRTSLENKCSIPKRKKKSMKSTSENTLESVESPQVVIKKENISQSRTSFNKKFEQTIDYSTDLDYEPSDDETSKEDSTVQKSWSPLFSSTVTRSKEKQSTHTTESTKQLPKEESNTQWEQLVVKISNSKSNSVSRVVAVGSSSNVITNKALPFSVPASVNVPATLPMQNQYNVPAHLAVQNQYNVYAPLAIQNEYSAPPPQAIKNQLNDCTPLPIQNQYNVRAPLATQNQYNVHASLEIKDEYNVPPPQAVQNQYHVRAPLTTPNQYNVRAPLSAQNQYNVRAPLAVQNQYNVHAPLVIQNLQHSLIPSRLSPGPDVQESQIRHLFKNPCFKFLTEAECGPFCGYNHALPPSEEVFRNMKSFSNDMVNYIYTNFVVRSKVSFMTYFKMMCHVFGMRRMEKSLVAAIKECERYSLQQFFEWIFEGLINAGLSKRDTLMRIIECCDQSLPSFDVLLEIMIGADALHFIDILKLHHQQGNVSSKLMMKLLQQVVDNPAPALLNLFIDMLHRYSRSNVCDIVTLKMLVFNIRNYIFSTGDLSLSTRFNEIATRFKLN